MVIAVTLTIIAAYDPVAHKFTALSIRPDLQTEVYDAIDIIRREMLSDNDLAMLIIRPEHIPPHKTVLSTAGRPEAV